MAGLISLTGKPEVPKIETRTRSRWWVSMIRCSCGLIKMGGDGGGLGGGTVAWARVNVFSGKNESLMPPSWSEPAERPDPDHAR